MSGDPPGSPESREPPSPPTDGNGDAEILARIARAIALAGAARAKSAAAPQPGREGEGLPLAEMARLAHELKTPLGAIAAAAEIMKDERLGPIGSERYKGYAADIHASASHALAVLSRVLETARVGANAASRPALTFAEIDLNALAAQTVSTLQPLAAGARVQLTTSLRPGLPHLIADAVSVRQILINLLTNALRATPADGRVEVRTGYTLDGPLSLSIVDTGPGLAAHTLTDLAEAAGLSGFGAGLGLGLPLVRELAQLNGAELALDSAPGRGTSATIVFGRDRVIPV